MTNGEIIQQELLRNKLKHEYLQKNVIHTGPISGVIQWSMWSQAPDNGFSLGHGVHVHDTARTSEVNVVAFLHKFEWRHKGHGKTIWGYYIQPDAITTPEILAEVKLKLEALVVGGRCPCYPDPWITWPTDRIYARCNG